MHYHRVIRILTVGLLAAGATGASAQSQWTWGHGDIGIELHGDHFHTHWGLNSSSVVDGSPISHSTEYHPEDLVARIERSTTAPASSLAALGVAPGSEVWQAGNNTYQPNLGFSADGIGFVEDWVDHGLTLSLSGWGSNNPGQFGLYSAIDGGWLFSTFSPASTLADNSLFIMADDHQHYAWYFTNPGYYALSITWSGTHTTEGFVTITDTYDFYVVPEPSSWALMLGGVAGIGAIALRRRQKQG